MRLQANANTLEHGQRAMCRLQVEQVLFLLAVTVFNFKSWAWPKLWALGSDLEAIRHCALQISNFRASWLADLGSRRSARGPKERAPHRDGDRAVTLRHQGWETSMERGGRICTYFRVHTLEEKSEVGHEIDADPTQRSKNNHRVETCHIFGGTKTKTTQVGNSGTSSRKTHREGLHTLVVSGNAPLMSKWAKLRFD